VKEVSNALCFSDPAYFTRFFAKKAGESPTAFRVARRDGVAEGASL
jgi:AraC-like DNA-binding protein